MNVKKSLPSLAGLLLLSFRFRNADARWPQIRRPGRDLASGTCVACASPR